MSETFSFRWGVPILDDDFTHFPNMFWRRYHTVISRNEWLFVCHLATYKYESVQGQCSPSLETVAEQMGYQDVRTVQRLRASLEEKGLLTVHYRPGQTSIYDFGGLSNRLLQLSFENGGDKLTTGDRTTTGGVARMSPGGGENVTRGVARMSPEEEKRKRTEEEVEKNVGADAPPLDPDLDDIEWNDGQGQHERPSVLKDPRASDPITLGQACAERQEEEAAKGRPLGWTVPGGAESIPDAMVAAWVTAKGLVPEQIPKELVDQYRRAMASAIKGLSATEDQAAQAVRHVLTHPDYAWYSYNHPKVEKFKQDVQSVILQILSGRFKANADGKLVEDVPLEELAQGTGYAAIMAYRELEERKMREAGEEMPKGLFDH